MDKEIILVPCDFSSNSENSLLHAIQLASIAQNRILLIYIHSKGLFHRELKDAQKNEIQVKLDALAEETEKQYGIRPETMIKEGKFSRTIKDIVEELNINLVIIGRIYETANKKITHTDIINYFKVSRLKKSLPIVIIHGQPAHNHYVEIVVPINYHREFKETLKWVMHLSKYYKCNINFIKPFYDDEEKKRLMANNMYFTKKMLDSNNIIYGIKTAKKEKHYADEIFRFGKDIDADLIVIMADKYKEYVLEAKSNHTEEGIIIPVMCIKPMPKKFQGFHG